MQFIVLDLEWNQALSGKPYKRDDLTLAGEIIQIGAVKLDDSMHIVDSLRICVAPKYYKKMHWSVKKLTGLLSPMHLSSSAHSAAKSMHF